MLLPDATNTDIANNLARVYPDQLEIRTLGRFAVLLAGKPLLQATGKSNKAALLFKYLLAKMGKAVPRDIILETFWPDCTSNNPEQALYSCIHRLRKGLEPNLNAYEDSQYITICDGLYSFNMNGNCWLDAAVFQNTCLHAQTAAKESPEAAVALYKEALSLYKGDFLAEHLYDDWVKPAQNYYHNLFREAVVHCASLLIQLRLYNEARVICENALILEPLDDDINLLLLEVMIRNGNLADARTHYQRFSSQLYQELGATPSPRIRSLYLQVKANEEKEPVMDLDAVAKALDQSQVEHGPMECETTVFRQLYKLEQRRIERSGLPVVLASLLLTSGNHITVSTKDLHRAGETLDRVLKCLLRKGDIICRWNEAQYLVLLSGVDEQKATRIMQRISNRYMEADPPAGVKLLTRHQAVDNRVEEIIL